MKALIVCHKTRDDVGLLGDILKQRGFTLEFHLGYHDTVKNVDPAEHDMVIVMGGPMGVYQADIFPYLNSEIAFIEKRIKSGKPYLGVCLGAQLMAKALGADVYKGEQGGEIGWHSIQVNEEGLKTPLRHLDAGKTRMLQWHGDTFDMPEGVKLLASSDLYKKQAIAYGDKALGVQFHPEITRDLIEFLFTIGFESLGKHGLSVPIIREQTQEYVATLNKQTTLFFNEWLDQVLADESRSAARA